MERPGAAPPARTLERARRLERRRRATPGAAPDAHRWPGPTSRTCASSSSHGPDDRLALRRDRDAGTNGAWWCPRHARRARSCSAAPSVERARSVDRPRATRALAHRRPAGARDLRALLRARPARAGRCPSAASGPGRSRARPATSCARTRIASCCSSARRYGEYMWTVVPTPASALGGAPMRPSTSSTGRPPVRDIFRQRRMWRPRPELEGLLRRRDHRRRLARPGHRLLPARSTGSPTSRAREELHRLGRGRAQHDDPALELQDARGRALLRRAA